jgi:hypothetical protein
MDDDALDHIPGQAGSLDLGLAFGISSARPGAAVIEMMQRGDHADAPACSTCDK